MSSLPQGATALVCGASRGIGLEFVRQLAGCGRFARIYATARRPGQAQALQDLAASAECGVVIQPMDVTDEASIAAVAKAIGEAGERLHLVVNVAGVLHDASRDLRPEKRLEDLDPQSLTYAFQVNAVGPALVAKHCHRLLAQDDKAVFASLSARVGSIGDNRLGGWYGYRASKAAQNMLIRGIAVELGRRARNVCCLALHPGTTDTELSQPFQGRVPEGKLFTPAFSVAHLLRVIDGASTAESGRFYAWDGKEIPW